MDDVHAPKESLAELGARLAATTWPAPDVAFSGRGIVICAGGARVFTNAYVLVSVLRKALGCTLPIEIWHFGPEEISPSMGRLLQILDVDLVDAIPLLNSHAVDLTDGWQLKPFAMTHSRFAEVLLLDADQVPVRNPAECFDWPEYAETGAVFWPDIVDLAAEGPVWSAFGLPPARTVSLESGQVLIDKRRHWRALNMTVALNAESDRLYQVIYGDKDSFLIAWWLAKATYAIVPHRPFADERYLVQRDFDGRPLFQHRTNSKWNYGGDQVALDGFIHEAACLDALADLRRRWGGRVFSAPDRSATARAAETELAAIGRFVLEAPAAEVFDFELLPYGEIGAGRSLDRLNWWCEEAAGDLWLVIASSDRITARLKRVNSDEWQGRRFMRPEHPVVLRRHLDAEAQPSAPGLVDHILHVAGFPFPSGDVPDDLAAALRLLARADAGIRTRIEALAADAPERFAPVLAALDERPDVKPPHVNIPVMRDHYRSYTDAKRE